MVIKQTSYSVLCQEIQPGNKKDLTDQSQQLNATSPSKFVLGNLNHIQWNHCNKSKQQMAV